MKGIYKRAPCLEKTGPEFSFPSGSWKKAGRNSDFRRLLLQFRRLPGKNIPRIFISFQFLKKSWQEFGFPAASLKKPDRKFQFRPVPGKNLAGILISFQFLEKSWQEFAIPAASFKKRRTEFTKEANSWPGN